MIYLDHNATTPVLPAVWEAMRPFAVDLPGNPASAHRAGQRARQALEDARERLAALLDAAADEVIFTSGATEANNLALFGLAGQPPAHLIASAIEHPSVAEPSRHLAASGFEVDYLSVDGCGLVAVEALAPLLRPRTRLVAVQLANHEMGAIQPIRRLIDLSTTENPSLARGAGQGPPWFHCDAVQAVGKLPVRFHELGATSLSLSAHKFHGPKGIGALLLQRGTPFHPLFRGGHQQQGRRPGTEPVALIVGMVTALELAHRDMQLRHERVLLLRQRFQNRLAAARPLVLNGPAEGGVPHTLNLSFPGCRSDTLLMNLDLAGVACSTGSACSSGSLLPSPVLEAMGIGPDLLHSALRFSFSVVLTEEEIDEAADRIVNVVNRLRQTSGD